MGFLDPSLDILWAIAVSCIWYGTVRSHEFFNEVKETAPEEIKFVQSKKIILLPILGSIVLIVLFFVLDYSITVYILTGLISLVVLSSQFFVFAPLADYIADKFSRKFHIVEPVGFKIPKIGFIPISGIVLFLYCVGVIALWICTGHWAVVDGIAWCLCVTQLSVLRLPSMKMATLLLVPFLVYDVFWVFISPVFFHGESVMVSVAVRLPPLPLLIKFPHFMESGAYAGLGLGDIALPGLFIVYLYSFDIHLNKKDNIKIWDFKNSYYSYFTLGLIQYTIGYFVTITVGSLMNSGQPALLYLVPFTLGFTALAAWRRGELGLIWRGLNTNSNDPKDVEAQELLAPEKSGAEVEESEREREAHEANAGESSAIMVNVAALDLHAISIEEQHHAKHPEQGV